MRSATFAFALLFGVAMSACGSEDPLAPPVDADAPIQTSASEYLLAPGDEGSHVTIDFVLRNTLNASVEIPDCGSLPIGLERWRDGVWEHAYGMAPGCAEAQRVRINPGMAIDSEIEVFNPPPGSLAQPRFLPDLEPPGTYRLIVLDHHAECRNGSCENDPELAFVSNAFVLR